MSFEADMGTTITIVITAFTLWATLVAISWGFYRGLSGRFDKLSDGQTDIKDRVSRLENSVAFVIAYIMESEAGESHSSAKRRALVAALLRDPLAVLGGAVSEPTDPTPAPVGVAD